MNITTVEVFDVWMTRWEDMLSYRRDLIHWKKVLKAAERDYQRTGLEAYQDEIEGAQYAIHQLEYYIAELKEKLGKEHYSPYDVLQLPQDASGKQIAHAYGRLHREAERLCWKWAHMLETADTQTKEIIFSNNLEKARFILHQIDLAYHRLSVLKPYYPGIPLSKNIAVHSRKHPHLKLDSDSQIFGMEQHHH